MSEDQLLYECTVCGKVSVSLGWLHAHIEKHRGYTPLNIQLPFTKTSPADFDRLMDYTEIYRVTDVECVELSELTA